MKDDVLEFWFGEAQGKWFRKDPEFDADVRARFEKIHDLVHRGELESWRADPRGALAYVIVLDQFSRNMFRGEARTFASDARALSAARDAIERGFDMLLTPSERSFLYMPFMHSEAIEDQDRAVELFASIGSKETSHYAELHRDIVRRFGRFPHRNAVLGRVSTQEELEFLKQPNSSC